MSCGSQISEFWRMWLLYKASLDTPVIMHFKQENVYKRIILRRILNKAVATISVTTTILYSKSSMSQRSYIWSSDHHWRKVRRIWHSARHWLLPHTTKSSLHPRKISGAFFDKWCIMNGYQRTWNRSNKVVCNRNGSTFFSNKSKTPMTFLVNFYVTPFNEFNVHCPKILG